MTTTGVGTKNYHAIYVGIVLCSLLFTKVAPACTGIRLTAEDGTVVYARTLEFNIDLDSNVIMVPHGYARSGTTPDGENGLKWSSKYAFDRRQRCGTAVSIRRRQ